MRDSFLNVSSVWGAIAMLSYLQTLLSEAGIVADSTIRASVGFKEFPASQGGWRGNFYAASCPCTVEQTEDGKVSTHASL